MQPCNYTTVLRSCQRPRTRHVTLGSRRCGPTEADAVDRMGVVLTDAAAAARGRKVSLEGGLRRPHRGTKMATPPKLPPRRFFALALTPQSPPLRQGGRAGVLRVPARGPTGRP